MENPNLLTENWIPFQIHTHTLDYSDLKKKEILLFARRADAGAHSAKRNKPDVKRGMLP